MSVEDWARREAEIEYKDAPAIDVMIHECAGFQIGIVHAFSALLSDEAMMGAVDLLRGWGYDINGGGWRAALQAAITAVTEGENDGH